MVLMWSNSSLSTYAQSLKKNQLIYYLIYSFSSFGLFILDL